MYQLVASVDQQRDYNLQIKTNFVKKHLVFAEILDSEVGGTVKNSLLFIYFDAKLFRNQAM